MRSLKESIFDDEEEHYKEMNDINNENILTHLILATRVMKLSKQPYDVDILGNKVDVGDILYYIGKSYKKNRFFVVTNTDKNVEICNGFKIHFKDISTLKNSSNYWRLKDNSNIDIADMSEYIRLYTYEDIKKKFENEGIFKYILKRKNE